MYAFADTKTKINQGVPALVPLGAEMWKQEQAKEVTVGIASPGSQTAPRFIHLMGCPPHNSNDVGDCVPGFSYRIRGAPCPQGAPCLATEIKQHYAVIILRGKC